MAILCCASPSKAFVEETRSTLKFASRAKLVEMKPKVNEVADDVATIKKLQHELSEAHKLIEELRMQLQQSEEMKSNSEASSNEGSMTFDEMNQSSDYNEPNSDPAFDNSENAHPNTNPLQENVEDNRRDRDYEKTNARLSDRTGANVQRRPYVMPKNQELQGTDLPTTSKHSGSSLKMKDVFRESESFSSSTSVSVSGGNQDLNASAAGFQLDAAEPRIARKTVQRYMKGDMQSVDSEDYFTFSTSLGENSDIQRIQSQVSPAQEQQQRMMQRQKDDTADKPQETTVRTEEESFDTDISLKFATNLSAPDTIRGTSVGQGAGGSGLADKDGKYIPNGRLEETLSWDTMDLNTMRPDQIGQPLRALQSLTTNTTPVPDEIMIISTLTEMGLKDCYVDKLKDAEKRIKFLEQKLEMSNDLIEATFRDLEQARLCIHDLVHRNVEINDKLKLKLRKEAKEAHEHGEMLVEQYWLLKGSMYSSLFFFMSGGHEYFLVSAFFVWLCLETNLAVE
jgi:hypothetical protein